jgi:hypothetical protein
VILRDISRFHSFFAKDDRPGNFSCQGESVGESERRSQPVSNYPASQGGAELKRHSYTDEKRFRLTVQF